MNTYKNASDALPKPLFLHRVMPRFCFCCGGKLEEVRLGFLACVECNKVYLPYENQDGEQTLALCNE